MTTIPPPENYAPLVRAWWKEAVIYQIYPSSFCDSNGDGIGDINGIISKLDYLKELGADALWLSPIFKSPQKDMGYDIADYQDIDPRYGTLDDWDRLAEAMHVRGMKIIMDLVPNHTSDEHEWFKESRSSRANPKRDWYYWRPPKYDADGKRQPPNNWKSLFQGSAWEWDETTQEYYLHLYVPGQPDLNWENPVVRNAVYDMMRFWLDRGCDGFRMDVINKISKVPGLPDAPVTNPREEFQVAHAFYVNGPRVHEFLQEMNREVLSKYTDIMTVGEAPFTHDMHGLAAYVLPSNHELNMVFQFQLMDIDAGGSRDAIRHYEPRAWTVREFKGIIAKWQTFLREEGFWNSVFIENHDQARSVSRFGNDSPQWRARSAKLLAMLQVAQTGTIYVYQGEELGLKNFPKSWGIEEYKDVASINYYNRVLAERVEDGKGEDMDDVMDGLQKKARDHARTPMQWDASSHAGFTSGTPWMRVNEDYKEWNAAAQREVPDSVFSFWKEVLQVRKANEVLIYGDFVLLDEPNDSIFAFTRSLDGKTALVLLNFAEKDAEIELHLKNHNDSENISLVLSNYENTGKIGSVDSWNGSVKLLPYEGRIYITTGLRWE